MLLAQRTVFSPSCFVPTAPPLAIHEYEEEGKPCYHFGIHGGPFFVLLLFTQLYRGNFARSYRMLHMGYKVWKVDYALLAGS